MRRIHFFGILTIALLAAACEPQLDPRVDIGNPPVASFEVRPIAGDSNRFEVEATTDAFALLWDFGDNASPQASTRRTDTVFYPQKGDYSIQLMVSDRGGTAMSTQEVNVKSDAGGSLCDDSVLVALLGGCLPGDKATWIWALEGGAISVGPVPYSTEWFTSPPNGLEPEQYDDSWTFSVDNFGFEYENSGETIFPEFNYEARPYDPPQNARFTALPGAGVDGLTRIVLSPEESFIGVKDSGPTYDIVSVDENSLVLIGEFRAGGGYFMLSFRRQ